MRHYNAFRLRTGRRSIRPGTPRCGQTGTLPGSLPVCQEWPPLVSISIALPFCFCTGTRYALLLDWIANQATTQVEQWPRGMLTARCHQQTAGRAAGVCNAAATATGQTRCPSKALLANCPLVAALAKGVTE